MPRINIGTRAGSEKKLSRSSKKDAASNANESASISTEMDFNNDFEYITHSSSKVSHMIESLQPSSKFESSCKLILQILNKHVLPFKVNKGKSWRSLFLDYRQEKINILIS